MAMIIPSLLLHNDCEYEREREKRLTYETVMNLG